MSIKSLLILSGGIDQGEAARLAGRECAFEAYFRVLPSGPRR